MAEDLFMRLPATKITKIQQFAPQAWAKAKVSEKLTDQTT
jgi:hypothetical protein